IASAQYFDTLGGMALSDINIKTDLKPLEKPLDKLATIKPYSYKRLDLDYKEEIGVIAQDVQKVYPLAVFHDQYRDLLGVNYSRLVVPLIAAINELNEKVKKLEKQLEEQRNGLCCK
ncbi:tail fiber domain-containing protein, partial [Zooshikella ganghwensis]|uniref:tail fiber domain-containing protein n=1 Tax=Zooshikella ganghwensis TaxID=202772 RepID=UPI0012FB3139